MTTGRLYPRCLLLDKANTGTILQLIEEEERRDHLRKVLEHLQQLRSVYRARHPEREAVQKYKAVATSMGKLLLNKFAYVAWPNYLHKIIEHVQEIIEDPAGPGSVGALSGEGNEAANKLFRELRNNYSRKHNTMDSLRDVIWYHWLYTSPRLRRVASVQSRRYTCHQCGQPGHSSLYCPNKD